MNLFYLVKWKHAITYFILAVGKHPGTSILSLRCSYMVTPSGKAKKSILN